jgi:hypothetical protein
MGRLNSINGTAAAMAADVAWFFEISPGNALLVALGLSGLIQTT